MDSIEIDGIAISPAHFINGERVASSETFEVTSPIDGHVIGRVACGSDQHCDQAMAAAQAAFPAWAALGAAARREHLLAFAAELRRRGDDLARVESEDNGMLLKRLRGHGIDRTAHNIEFFAEHALKMQGQSIDGDKAQHAIHYDPAGVAVLITPWNSPLMLTTWKLGPALAAGNTVVVKPPEWAPLTCSLLAEIAQASGLPSGVLNVVQGLGSTTGARLVADSRAARISFTGSVPTAKVISRAASEHLTPCSLELGGKSAFIVLADADIDKAADTAALQYRNAGQVCLAGTRLLVHESVKEQFLAKLEQRVKTLRLGDPREDLTEIGPLIHPVHLARVEGFVQRARDAGAIVHWGGKRDAFGEQFFQPTLLSGLPQDAEIVQNEVFGPVLVLQTFAHDAEAVALANGTPYGLAGVVFGEDAHATGVAEQLRTGMVWKNAFFLRDLNAPFGGRANSGVGREGGHWSFDFFCDVKDVMTPKSPFKPVFAGQ